MEGDERKSKQEERERERGRGDDCQSCFDHGWKLERSIAFPGEKVCTIEASSTNKTEQEEGRKEARTIIYIYIYIVCQQLSFP